MLSLIEQIRTGALWDFPGGVHPAENKRQSNQQPLVHAALANEIVLPLKQHIGKPGNILVNVGDHVLKGQLLTQSNAGFTLPIHASTSGSITAIETRTVAHPSGLSEMCVVITPDGQDTWCEKQPVVDYSQQNSDYLLDVIRMAGISGMGGAGFPTAKKIQSGLGRTEILIVNAAECEPYITADDKLLQEHAEEVLQGIEIVEHILQPKLTIIGIEDNKPEAIKALESAAQNKDIVIRVIPTKYPSGGEKQLIKVLTNKEVPAGGIPADIGILVQNVGSLYAIKRAVIDGEPMVNRVVTLTGNTFETPRNVWVPLGTPVHALLEQFGYQADKKLPRLIMGGPMMGFSLPHANVPITKTSNCILAPTRKEISPAGYEMECIRCGACAEACPASLLPQQLQWHAKAEEFDKCEELNLKDCIECGACAFVCPSEIPLVSYYRQAKAEIRTRAQEADAAERAKLRFEEKKARMEREKEERENRFKKAAEDRRKEMKSTGGDDAIAAAIARVKAQKTQDSEQTPSVKPAVAAAIAKAKAKQAAAADSGSSEPDNSEMVKLREERKRLARERKAEKEQSTIPDSQEQGDKKSAVAAAIARAKAKKAQQPPLASSESSAEEPEDKKAAVAAAIARAKARKAQQADEPAPEQNREESQAAEDDPKKAAVAAAIARAKARKAQQADEPAPEQNRVESQVADDDPKKAAVAAAIARAKARKAQQTDEPAPEQNREELQPAEDDPKKAAVTAAIARAKARKAQQAGEPAPEQNREESQPAEDDPKKAAVAAAIARTKARKAQQAGEPAPEQDREESQPAEDDPKKAAVAAAIARAKARKAQQAGEPAPEQNREKLQPAEDDPKKAAVAAAIARAKARKAQQAEQKQNTEENE
ncbi:TPA: electron transport complex subunit RsxC [Vibrio vulnificus]|uniref:electron transport complex subunit RsxC n=1 Tax=Vibrio vulnificus TaxID=672 RepID=UPI0010293300|nr:electron transport complex subunit RsxC [Vibrio vulnificus]EGQ9990847.1 electron transport complex subunit RsxC [Vibrio vulnificus]ELP8108324.1 electron transport complex subunit RsxC [Vibrio vulnificus]RZR41348.1 electron transport complex subunit RsxC [Vibrio vulnificus]HAS8122517.1 electron transport complex subunit RsxC [Vibrio vulnificus]HAS8378168.1 electron transport complex subunit RsxC [Vibrio vulnificus]